MADRSFGLPLAFRLVMVRVRTGSSPSQLAKGEGSSEGLNVATAAITVSTDSGGVAADGLSSV